MYDGSAVRVAGPLSRRIVRAAALVVLVAGCTSEGDTNSSANEADNPYPGHRSEVYAGTENWICHPSLDHDPCRDLSATAVAVDGSRRRADLELAEDPAIDCFYVYPTISTDPELNSDLEPDEMEWSTVAAQAAPFASTCRVFAPVYRQVTGSGFREVGFSGGRPHAIAQADIVDAWRTYVSRYNDGRGVVLIGHSQGTGRLKQLIADEIDGAPRLRERLVSAILLGSAVVAPDGEEAGGTFQNVPACRSANEVGCVISFSSFPADAPPDPNAPADEQASLGRAEGEEGRALCVDPVALAGGNRLADAIVPTEGVIGRADVGIEAATRFVRLPGALEARCDQNGEYDYLAMGPASRDDRRAVEGLLATPLGPEWGMHIYDPNLVMGDLLEVVEAQTEAHGLG